MNDTAFWNQLLNNWQADLLMLSRIMGIFSFNPMFSRRNLPVRVKVGASLALTLVILTAMTPQPITEYNSVGLFAVAVLGETFIGLVLGFLSQLFLSTLQVGGEVMDMVSGLGMAKIYDPGSGSQMPLFGSAITYLFVLYFFATNAHLSYIKIFVLSFDAIPLGSMSLNGEIGKILVDYFATILELSLKLALPIMASQFLLQICVGLMMKAVPQVQVMAVNIQLEMLVGIGLLFLLSEPISEFISKYINIMTQSIYNLMLLMPSG